MNLSRRVWIGTILGLLTAGWIWLFLPDNAGRFTLSILSLAIGLVGGILSCFLRSPNFSESDYEPSINLIEQQSISESPPAMTNELDSKWILDSRSKLPDYEPVAIEAKKVLALYKLMIHCVELSSVSPKFWFRSIRYSTSGIKREECNWVDHYCVIGEKIILDCYNYSEPGNPFIVIPSHDIWQFMRNFLSDTRNRASILASDDVKSVQLFIFGNYVEGDSSPRRMLRGRWGVNNYERTKTFIDFETDDSFTVSSSENNYSKCFAYGVKEHSPRIISILATDEGGNVVEYDVYFDEGYTTASVDQRTIDANSRRGFRNSWSSMWARIS